ncbi:MAG TPA: ankyrin repeat domain-containing protein [Steroidobacteraceae bacterium]|jgi:ankyrin repeat protein
MRALPLLVVAFGLSVAQAEDPVVDLVKVPAPLVEAAQARDESGVLKLLAANPHPDVNQHSADGTTALHWAVYHNDVPLIDKLVALHADVNAKNEYGSTPMSEAAVVGNVAVLKKLLAAGADVESPNGDGQTALMIIARTDNVEAAKLLVSRGAKVNAREQWRYQTALMWAAAEAQPTMVEFLVKHGAEVDARSNVNNWARQVTAEPRMQARPSGGFTPMLYAARKGCVECVRALIKAGADVNLADPDGVTPMVQAVENFNFDVASLLIDHHAELNKWDLWGRSPLYSAVDMNTLPVSGRADRPSKDRITSLELIEKMLNAGANPNLQLKLFPPYRALRADRGADGILTVGTTPLLRAAKAGDVAAMKLLLAHGADPNLPTEAGVTPLMAAAGTGSLNLDTRGRYKTEAEAIAATNVLVAAGADVNARDSGGQTALHGAAGWGWNGEVKALVANNIDLLAKDSRGRTAADIAMGAGGSSGRATSNPHPQTEALLRQLMSQKQAGAASRQPPIASTKE